MFLMSGKIRKILMLVSAPLLGCAALFSGCSDSSQPNFELLPSLSMMDQHSVKAQKEETFFADGRGMRTPPEGTIPRGYQGYPYKKEDDATKVGTQFSNPLPKTPEVLARGKKIYDTYCIVCHGPKGKSDGYVVPKFPMPPSLHSEKVRKWPDGSIFHVISAGQNLMPSYAIQIEAMDRWAVIHYVRALQTAVNP